MIKIFKKIINNIFYICDIIEIKYYFEFQNNIFGVGVGVGVKRYEISNDLVLFEDYRLFRYTKPYNSL